MGNFAPSSARRDKPICNEPASQNLFFRCPPSTTDSPESSSLPSREVRTKNNFCDKFRCFSFTGGRNPAVCSALLITQYSGGPLR